VCHCGETRLLSCIVLRADRVAVSRGVVGEIRGVGSRARLLARRTRLGTRFARPVLVDGTVGLVVAPPGRQSSSLPGCVNHPGSPDLLMNQW
jgi:hypothetical protein